MLTRTGLGVLVGAVICVACGFWWRYEELIALAIAALIAVGAALIVARRASRHTVRRRLLASRIARGEALPVRYVVYNQTQRRLGTCRLVDSFQGVEQYVDVPSLRRMTRFESEEHFHSRRRGIFPIGPLAVDRSDPLSLATARRTLGDTDTVTVHPKIYELAPASGAVRVISNDAVLRRPSNDPMAGFQSLREYQYGDDFRLIHWPTSARAATLMIREFVDLRRNEFTVVVDTSADVASADDFEEIVDVAASIAAFALRAGLNVVVRTTSRERAGRPYSLVDIGELLELLTPVTQGSGADVLSIASLFTGGLGDAAVLVVTGPRGPSSMFGRGEQISVARIDQGADIAGLQCQAMAASDAPQFVERWALWG